MFKLVEKEEAGYLENIVDKQNLCLGGTKKCYVGTEWWLIRRANSFQYAGGMTGLRGGNWKNESRRSEASDWADGFERERVAALYTRVTNIPSTSFWDLGHVRQSLGSFLPVIGQIALNEV